MTALLLHSVQTLTSLQSITQKFLVVGHTQNEGDAMHALIEREKRRAVRGGPIYVPSQLIPIIHLAKKTGHPYKAIEMDTTDFYDVKGLQPSIGKNFTVDEDGNKVLWSKLCVIRVEKKSPDTILYKTSYLQKEFQKINVRSRQRGRPSSPPTLTSAYECPPQIANLKKLDLLSLCKSNAIPRQHHDFFSKLSSEKAITTVQISDSETSE